MTHDEALDVLTAWIVVAGRGTPTSIERRAAAEEHVSRCPDCWDEVCATHELIVGSQVEAAARMRELFECTVTQRQLYLLVGLSPAAIEKERPRLAKHLASCQACRDQLADLVEIDGFVDEPHQSLPLRPRWTETLARSGERLLDLVGEFVVRVGQDVIALADWPGGLSPVAVGVPVSPRGRRQRHPGGEPPAAQKFNIPLGEENFELDVVFEPHEGGRGTLSITVVKGVHPFSIVLRRVDGEQEQLIAALQSADPSEEFIATGLRPGQYRLVVGERTSPVRYRLAFRMEPTT